MKLAVRLEFCWPEEMAIERPPLLHCGASSNEVQGLSVFRRSVASFSRVPEIVTTLELVIARGNFDRWQLGFIEIDVIVLIVRITLVGFQSEIESSPFITKTKKYPRENLKAKIVGEKTYASYFVDIFCVFCKDFYTKI